MKSKSSQSRESEFHQTMNNDTNMNLDVNLTDKKNSLALWEESAFASIDGPIRDDSVEFSIWMLRLGRILTAKEAEKRNYTAAKVSNLMFKHRDLRPYRPMEIREKLWNYCYMTEGGGVRFEFYELSDPHRRNDPPHFNISFYRIDRPKPAVKPDQPKEPAV